MSKAVPIGPSGKPLTLLQRLKAGLPYPEPTYHSDRDWVRTYPDEWLEDALKDLGSQNLRNTKDPIIASKASRLKAVRFEIQRRAIERLHPLPAA